MEVLALIVQLLQQYTYTFLFAGIFIAGEAVLVPAAYLTVIGVLEPFGVLLTVALVSLSSDSLWYWIGRRVGWERLCQLPLVCRRRDQLEHLTPLFTRHGAKAVFIAHFLYGTRNVVQVLCGMHHTPFVAYLASSFAGSMLWASVLLFVVHAVEFSMAQFMNTAQHIEITAAVAALVVAILFIAVHRLLSRRVLRG